MSKRETRRLTVLDECPDCFAPVEFCYFMVELNRCAMRNCVHDHADCSEFNRLLRVQQN